MNSIVNGITFILIFSAVSYCNCENGKVFTMIYAVGKEILLSKSDQPEKTTQLKKLINEVTGIIIHKGYLYAATKTTSWLTSDSTIWRYKIIDPVNNILGPIEKVDEVRKMNKDILCMVTVNDDLFAGRTDGFMWRCSLNAGPWCVEFAETAVSNWLYTAHFDITGIDYNADDEKIYATLSSGTLWRCSRDVIKSCLETYKDHEYGLTAIKIAFKSAWVGTENGKLLKCPLEGNEQTKCTVFDSSVDESAIVSMVAADGYLYARLNRDGKVNKNIWRCNVTLPGSCTGVFSLPQSSGSMIFV